MGDYFSLDEICNKNDFVLVDTCAFEESLANPSKEVYSPKERLERIINSNRNLSFWLERIPLYKKIYSTDGIVSEIRNWKYNYKKAIKEPIFKNRNRKIIPKLRRELSVNKKNRINLTNLLESEGRIFKISESQKQIYNLFSERYSFLADEFDLSEVDFDLLILGGVISREKNTSIISNDLRGIRNAWRFFLKQEVPSGRGFYFYSAYGVNFFKREK